MSDAVLFALIAVACSLVAAIVATRSRGPRVTQIETRTDDIQGDR
jgi:hypothetical protein